jgi:hypothetical protein
VTIATWAGSAVVGGLLVDKYGILTNFLLTASFQALSCLPLFLVVNLVPAEKGLGPAAPSETDGSTDPDVDSTMGDVEEGMEGWDEEAGLRPLLVVSPNTAEAILERNCDEDGDLSKLELFLKGRV